MEAVIGLLVLMLGVSHGDETSCDGRQDGALCFGPLGGTVGIQLMDSASEFRRYTWLKNLSIILSGIDTGIITNKIKNRSSFTVRNGTFRINDLNMSDGGEYKLQTFDSDGKKSAPQTLQLIIQAPVSSVLLDSECLSQGEMRVSCSSEGGDSPQYSWTLDGRSLTDAELLPGKNQTSSITLKQHVSGRLECSVRNNVSLKRREEKISNCGFIYINCTSGNETQISQWVFAANNTLCIVTTTTIPDTTVAYLPAMAGVLSALVILLVVGVVVVCAHKRKQNSKPQEEDGEELTYADVRIVQRPGRHVPKREEMEVEVEYGQVRFSERPRQPVEPAGDECVYAKVRKAR